MRLPRQLEHGLDRLAVPACDRRIDHGADSRTKAGARLVVETAGGSRAGTGNAAGAKNIPARLCI
jgi:hypothetical protein